MKICWDNLERIRLSKDGCFRMGKAIYVETGPCKKCGYNYLDVSSRNSSFCSLSCSTSGENNGMYGKIHTVETRKKMSENRPDITGVLNHNYKDGIYALGLTVYDTYKNALSRYEDIRKQENTEVLEAKCTYCGQWFTPTYVTVCNRLVAVKTLNQGEQRLYCSDNCKKTCPTYKQQYYPKGFKHVTSREVDPYLRKMVLERDNWACQICGKTINEAQLHCHHMDPATQNPMFQNDMDSCITLCKDCHKKVHKQYGCRYIDLQCKKG